MERNRCHEPNHLHRPNTDMDLRDSLSRLKKQLKHPLTGRKRKPDQTRVDATREGVHQAGSFLRPGPDGDGREVGQGYLHMHPDVEVAREGNGVNGGRVEQVYPSPSAPSIPHSGKPDSTRMLLFQLLGTPDHNLRRYRHLYRSS